jgi:hypothetical protein
VDGGFEQLRRRARDPVRQVRGVRGGRLQDRIVQAAFFGVRAAPGLEPGALLAQPGRRREGGDRFGVDRDVDARGIRI